MTLFNNLSEGSPGRDSDSSPPSGAFANSVLTLADRLLGSVSAAAGGVALRAEQVLSDLASSPPLPSPGSALQTFPSCLFSNPEQDSQPSEEARQSKQTRQPPHLFRGLAGPLPARVRARRTLPEERQKAPPGASHAEPRTPRSLSTAPIPSKRHRHHPAHSRIPLSQEHPSGVTGPLKSKSDGHPYRSPWSPLSPPCSRPPPTPLGGPGDARVGTLRTPL